MIAAFSFYQTWQAWHWPLLIAVAVVLLVEMPLLAVVVEIVFMRRLHGASTVRTLMVTLGLLLILFAAATAIWNPTELRVVPSFFAITDQVGIFGVNVSYQELLTVCVAAVLAVGLWAFFRVFRIGISMRAVVDDPELVSLAGAKPYRISQMGWALGFFMAGVAGVLLSATVSTTGLNISTLTLLVVNGYAAAVVGRLRSLPLTFAGAMALGLVVQYSQGYLPGHIPTSLEPVIQEVIPVIFLFVALLVVPAARLAASGRLPSFAAPKVSNLPMSVIGAGVVVVLSLILAGTMSGINLNTMSLGLALGIVGLSMVLLTGYAGQVSLCQLTIMGIGAFTMGKIAGGGSWLGLLAGVGASAAVGALLALPALRLRGLYLALATLAFAEAAYYAFFQNPSLFGNFGGNVSVGRLGFFGMKSVGDRFELVEIAVAFGLCAILVLAIRRSPSGRRLVALNDSPAAFATLGMDAKRSKIAVFAVSAGLAGLGGCLYAGQQGSISAQDVQFISSLTLLLLVTIAGIRTISGALIGGLAAAWLPAAQVHLPRAFAGLAGLVAGIGIVLLGRSPDGVIGMALPWLRRHVPLGPPSRGVAGVQRGSPPDVGFDEERVGVAG
jgi:branched-chain amino acid transport system permease protein